MPPPTLRLDEAFDQIIDAVVARLSAAMEPGELLAGIGGIVSGDRTRRRPRPPYLWVAGSVPREEHPAAIHGSPTLALLLTAFVASEDPQVGWRDAMRWASRAASVLLVDRRLGLDLVQDVRRNSVEPLGQIRDGRRFAAAARVDVVFTIKET